MSGDGNVSLLHDANVYLKTCGFSQMVKNLGIEAVVAFKLNA